MRIRNSLSCYITVLFPLAAIVHLNSAQRNSEEKMFKDSTRWSMWLIYVLLSPCNPTGCNCTASRQQFSARVLFVSSFIEITAMQNPLWSALCCLWQSQLSLSHHIIDTEITKPKVALAGSYRYLYLPVCLSVCVQVAFQRKHRCSVLAGQVLWGDDGTIFQLAALVRRLPGTQIARIDFAQPQLKRRAVITMLASAKL